ncbi:hypothetical protein [Streptomyces sp. JCM 18897]
MLGADEPGKRELAADLLDAALLVVDDHELAAATGTLATPGLPTTPRLSSTAVPTLTDLLTGAHPGRTSPDTRTAYAPVGLPWQDLALSWLAHERARERGVGRDFDFLG